MKLVEILARELMEWPKGAEKLSQTFAGMIFYLDSDGHIVPLARYNIAEDWVKSEVTRAEWEAERAKLKAPKTNGDGWIRHRGGKCPVGDGTLVDVKWRSGNEWLGMIATGGPSEGEWSWRNNPGSGNEIMKYRIHKPAEQPDEHDLTSLAEKAGIKRMAAVASEVIITSGPIEWRDRIRELDVQCAEVESTYQRQISEITQERESLVQKLAVEGLALVEVVVQPVEDMSDWRNWRAGDVVEYVGLPNHSSEYFTLGNLYVVSEVKDHGGNPVLFTSDDSGEPNGWKGECFKFVSRSAS